MDTAGARCLCAQVVGEAKGPFRLGNRRRRFSRDVTTRQSLYELTLSNYDDCATAFRS